MLCVCKDEAAEIYLTDVYAPCTVVIDVIGYFGYFSSGKI